MKINKWIAYLVIILLIIAVGFSAWIYVSSRNQIKELNDKLEIAVAPRIIERVSVDTFQYLIGALENEIKTNELKKIELEERIERRNKKITEYEKLLKVIPRITDPDEQLRQLNRYAAKGPKSDY